MNSNNSSEDEGDNWFEQVGDIKTCEVSFRSSKNQIKVCNIQPEDTLLLANLGAALLQIG